MKVSVIGCGNISRSHFKVLEKMEDVTITSVADIKKERADLAAENHGAKAYYDYIEMLDTEKPDCVHICTPHYLHAEMAAHALKRNINVICEKPCAMTKEGLEKIKAAQKESDAQFGVCFQNRYNNAARKIRTLILSGKYGKVKGIRANVCWCRKENYYSDDWHGTLAFEGGSVLINQAIHTLDLMRYVSGCNFKSVSGHVFNDTLKGVIETEDTAVARFETESGCVAILYATIGFSLDSKVLIDIFTEEATLRIEGASGASVIDKNGNITSLTETENEDDSALTKDKAYWGNGHEALINDFYDCIKTGRKFEIDSFEGGKSVSEFTAVYESSKTNKPIIIEY